MAGDRNSEKILKNRHISNGSTDRHQIWRGDAYCPMNFIMPARTLHLLFYLIKRQKIKTKLAVVYLRCKSRRIKTANINLLFARKL